MKGGLKGTLPLSNRREKLKGDLKGTFSLSNRREKMEGDLKGDFFTSESKGKDERGSERGLSHYRIEGKILKGN